MDTRPKVGRRIRFVERSYHSGEQVITRHYGGAQVVAVWPERTDDQEDRHSGEQEGTGPEIIVPILKEEVEDDYSYIGEPQKIRDDENLTEGNVVVRSYVDQVIAARYRYILLQPGKPLQIDDSIEQQRQCVPVFVIIIVADPGKLPRCLFSVDRLFFHKCCILTENPVYTYDVAYTVCLFYFTISYQISGKSQNKISIKFS